MILLAVGLALALAVPLVAPVDSFIYAFVVPKVLLLRVAAVVCLLGWLSLWLRDRGRHALRRTPITVAFGLFVASAIVSTTVSVDVHRSVWDTQERMLGVVTLLHLLALYLAATHGLTSAAGWRQVLRAFLLVGSSVVSVAIAQKLDPVLLGKQVDDPRVAATLGHPTYLAGVGVFQFAVGAYVAATERTLVARLLAATAGLLGLVALVLAESRGPLLGLAVGGLVALISLAVVAGPGRARRWSIGLAAASLALALGALPLLGLEGELRVLEHEVATAAPGERAALVREFEFKRGIYDAVYSVPAARRFLRTSVTRRTADTRLMKWGVAWAAFREAPVLGFGPNGYPVAYDRFHPTRSFLYGGDEVWVDDAHNVLLNVLGEQGVVGLLAYLLLLGAPVFVVWRAWRRGRFESALVVFVTGFTAAHFVHLFFVFENPTSWLYIVLLLAFVNARTRAEPIDERGSAEPASPRRAPLLAGAALAVAALVTLFVAVPARANLRLHHAIGQLHEGRADQALAALDASLAAGGPHGRDARSLFAVAAIDVTEEITRVSRTVETPEQKERVARAGVAMYPLLERAFDELAVNVAEVRNVRPVVQRAQIAVLIFRRFQKTEPLPVVAAELDAAISRAPGRADLRLLRADVAFAMERPAEAIAPLRALVDRAPDIGSAWWRLAFAEFRAGDPESARATIDAATATGHAFDEQTRGNLEGIRGMIEEGG